VGERRDACRVLVGKPEGKKPLGTPRHSWDDNVKMILKKWDGGMDWIDLAQNSDRWQSLVNAVMNFSDSIKWGKFLD
jgi:hypothetical protein